MITIIGCGKRAVSRIQAGFIASVRVVPRASRNTGKAGIGAAAVLALPPMFMFAASTSVRADHGGLGVGLGIASPIVTDSAITLPDGKWVVGERTQWVQFNRFSNPQMLRIKNAFGDGPRADVHSLTGILNPALFAAYGVTDTLSVGLRLPAVARFNVRAPAEDGDHVDVLGDATGFGDITAFGQYRFWHTKDNSTHASLLFGLQMPTGMDHVKTKQGEPFDPHFQPGTGAWSPFVGAAFTHGFGQWSVDTSYQYQFQGTGVAGSDQGDDFLYNVAVSYALSDSAPNPLYAETNSATWVLVAEINGEWRASQNTHGVVDPNTGGNTIYLSPGFRYAGGANWNVSFSFGAPIVRNEYGHQNIPDYRIVNRISITF
ncbi:transporter [Methylococcus sp. ANG]|uniref:transporter n=1 Tax=unclassified Methylococcus TaxID=2618889 RepID=UPI001C5302BA|nr:transporter [Methylococcus sp. Mc7]QXP82627.1 transporter [Methylococcus sp. Mc7]